MPKVKTFFKLLKTPLKLILSLSKYNLLNWMRDETYLKLLYKAKMDMVLNLDKPTTFNEKLQWLKLYDRNPLYTKLVDKYEVRKYIAETIGEEYLIPLYGVWDSPDEIDFDSLPDQFVLKCTHDSGSVIICDDKSKFDINRAKKKLKKAQKFNFYYHGREWPYKNVKPRIIVEAYISDVNGELNDYKLMCFNGKVKCSFVCSERYTGKGLHVTFFDQDWNVMPFERSHPSVKEGLSKPIQHEKMVELAQVLAGEIPFVRIDFYEVDGHIYFGEMTFYPGCGCEAFQPQNWDRVLGDWIQLPEQSLQ